jgi:tetratricopeptide (TPR) repeat protein
MIQKRKSKIKNPYPIRNSHWVSILVIIGLTLGIYAQSVKFNFSYFDDHAILLEHKEFFTTDFSIKETFTTSAFVSEALLYRPLQNITFALDAKIAGGIEPWAYHFTNLVLFIFIGLSLYFFLLKFKIAPRFALLGTLLFIANPLNVWSVVWVPARGDLLLTLFTLLSFICFINFLRANRFIDLFLTFLCFTLALFSKENAVIIPFLFLFYFIYTTGRFISKINYKHFILAGLMLCVGIFWLYLRNVAVIQLDESYPLKEVIYNLINFPVALSQIVFPYEMAPFPKFTLTKIILGSVIALMLLYLIIKERSSRWENLFFVSWFFLFLLPSLFTGFKHIDYLEHRYLLPQIGILVIIIKFVQEIFRRSKEVTNYNRFIYPILCFVIVAFSITSFVKARTLQNPVTILDATEKYNGISVLPYLNRGGYYTDLDKFFIAAQDFGKVLQLDPANYDAIVNLAKINMMNGKNEEAIALYTLSLSLNNKDHRIYENRSQAKIRLGDLQGALLDVDTAIMMNSNVFLLYNNRGILKMNLGLTEDALSDFEEAARLSNYTNTDVLYNSAVVKYRFGDFPGALQDCDQALKLEPHNNDLHVLRERILNQ